jgi:HEAT repeat protein
MADATLHKVLELLRPETASELRGAAALVLGEVGVRDGHVDQAICQLLDDPDPNVRSRAMNAIGKLRIEKALGRLVERVSLGGEEGEAAAYAVARLGARGTRALQELMPQTAPGLRRRIASALAATDTASAETAALDALLDNDPGVVDASARSLISKVPSFSKQHRKALVERVLDLLGARKPHALPLASEAVLVRLLSALEDPRGEAAFWARVDATRPAEIRASALQALGVLPIPTNRDKLLRLLACACDPDFRVAAPALMILKNAAVSDRSLGDWLPLLEAPDPGTRRFAMEKIGAKDKADVANALVRQLDHPDRGLRELAISYLAKMDHGRDALVRALRQAANPDQAWALARVQAPHVRDYPSALLTGLFKQACAYLEGQDRRADALLFLLREADPRNLRDRLEERALAHRKKKNYSGALIYLRLLTRDPACVETIRFEQAACSLKVSPKDLAADARASDPALHQFGGLLHRHETEPIKMVEKAKWLDPEDLFFLGFHFAEKTGAEKEFGGLVLRLFIKRSPRAKQAKDAKSKLRSQGLEQKAKK